MVQINAAMRLGFGGSWSGNVVGERHALACGFDGPSMCAVGDPVGQCDDLVADKAQVSNSPNPIAICADVDDAGWGSIVLVSDQRPTLVCRRHVRWPSIAQDPPEQSCVEPARPG